jgi:putative addiction module component (TIGR02574 family)
MQVIADIEKQALSLPDQDRAKLADRLIASLPADFAYDEEIEEAERRSREMDEDPSTALSHEEFFKFFEERRGQLS